MSVAVACNLSDGIILGVDSAVTVPGPGGIVKVYENAQKLYQLGERPIGVAFYGIGAIGSRSMGSLLREFVVRDPSSVLRGQTTVQQIVEQLRIFFSDQYQQIVVPAVVQATGKPFDQFTPAERQGLTLGIVVGGFSQGEYLSELWNVSVPGPTGTAGIAELKRAQGNFGSEWFAMLDPIRRYIKGWSLDLMNELATWAVQLRGGNALDPAELQQFNQIVGKYEYQIPFPAMPMREGVSYVKFLVDLVIGHHRYAVGAPIVGGKARLGLVTYLGGKFELLDDN